MGDLTKGHTFSPGDDVTAELLHNLVEDATISASAVTSGKVASGAISNTHIAAAAGIALGKIAVTDGKLAGGSGGVGQEITVGTGLTLSGNTLSFNSSASAVTSGGLADGAVVEAKIGASAVTSDKISDGAVGFVKFDSDFVEDVTEAAPATGDYLVFGDTSATGNLRKATVGSVLDLQTVSFQESATAAVSGGAGVALTVAHGLAAAPSYVRTVMVCTDAGGDIGYAQNDEVDVNTFYANAYQAAWAATVSDATNIKVVLAGANNAVYGMQKDGLAYAGVTTTKWAVKVYYRE